MSKIPRDLIEAACEAEERYGVDECERFADDLKRKKEKLIDFKINIQCFIDVLSILMYYYHEVDVRADGGKLVITCVNDLNPVIMIQAHADKLKLYGFYCRENRWVLDTIGNE